MQAGCLIPTPNNEEGSGALTEARQTVVITSEVAVLKRNRPSAISRGRRTDLENRRRIELSN